LLGSSTVEAHAHMAGHSQMASTASPLTAMLATGIHTVGYLVNFNLVWGVALVATGLFTLLT
jgi:hypothetical protein